MMTSPAHSLDEEQQAANSLLQLLTREQSCLVESDVDGLSRLTEEKAHAALRMTEMAKQRHRKLAEAGYDASETGMQAWLDTPAATAADSEAWNGLITLAKSAKEMNRVNGMLIAQHMARNQSALNVLQGNAQGGSIYGPNGQATTKIGSRRLVTG
jgi:flagella synthesis protein FlgN